MIFTIAMMYLRIVNDARDGDASVSPTKYATGYGLVLRYEYLMTDLVFVFALSSFYCVCTLLFSL